MSSPRPHSLNSNDDLHRAVRELTCSAPVFNRVIEKYGPPPLWKRNEGFATLIRIILEQQVSLASAKAAYNKLHAASTDLNPEVFLEFSDHQLKEFGFSRQKTKYGRALANALHSGELDLATFPLLADSDIRSRLTRIKGIGNWTANIYLLMAMGRPDIWPVGDIALAAAYGMLTGMDARPDNKEMATLAREWKPYRSVAAHLLWHYYLSEKKRTSG